MNNLTAYLNEIKTDLYDLYENLDQELLSTDNQALIDDSYDNITSKLASALSELDSLIADIDGGIYDSNLSEWTDDELPEA